MNRLIVIFLREKNVGDGITLTVIVHHDCHLSIEFEPIYSLFKYAC
jgi:hypothetical protein